jgi:serine/threonine protein phosphatase PrpC
VLNEISTAFQKSHEKVLAEGAAESGYEGMATTLTMAYVLWPRAFIVQVGDSRLYLLRDGWLDQITRDQTMAEDLVDQGILKPELAEKSRWSNVLSGAVGGRNPTIDPQTRLRSGDLGNPDLSRHGPGRLQVLGAGRARRRRDR